MGIPVITLDGPSASGKGTVAGLVAAKLGFHYLDSGALYRLMALYATRHGIAFDNEARLALAAVRLPVVFQAGQVLLESEDVTDAIRSEAMGLGASSVAVLPALRSALLQRQRDFRAAPGLVTDGRDMGSVVFPDATLKIYLTASAEERARRRHKQLIDKGEAASIRQIQQDIEARDARDAARTVAPLKAEADAHILDTTSLSIQAAVDQVLSWFSAKNP